MKVEFNGEYWVVKYDFEEGGEKVRLVCPAETKEEAIDMYKACIKLLKETSCK
ncbi:MAG: hypothetical protein WC479_11545 [Candidatus Izemoplasmatales bacterium]